MVAGYILTGGKNRRMNGHKKLLLKHRGRLFLEWILDAMESLPRVYLSVEDADLWRELLTDLKKSQDTREKVDKSVDNQSHFVDKSVDIPVDSFVEEDKGTKLGNSAGKDTKTGSNSPVEKTVDKQRNLVDNLVNKSVDISVDKSEDRFLDIEVDNLVDKPVDNPVEWSVDRLVDNLIEDKWDHVGPLGGIVSGLMSCEEDALFVVACDMPCIKKEHVERLLRHYQKERIITVAGSKDRPEPLFGVYPKSALPALAGQLKEGNLRMMDALKTAGYCCVDIEKKAFRNVNTPKDYEKLSPYIFAVSGYKNSGKTTLITGLIPELTKSGYKVAVIKHDGHDFEPDVPGTDSYRHRKAGAYGTAVYSGNRFMVTRECSGMNERVLMQAFPDADIILIEGLKNSDYPKYICEYPDKSVISPKELADRIIQAMESRKDPDDGQARNNKAD